MYFDVFGFFSYLRACNVSVVASGVFLHVGKSIAAQKLSRRPGEPNTYVFGEKERKKMIVNVFGCFGCFCIIMVVYIAFIRYNLFFLYI